MIPVMYGYILMLIMYMKYAVDELGVEPAVVGTIFLVAKIWDAVSDPLIGNLSDRTKLPSGRRKPWLLAAAPLVAVFSVMAWVPPESLDGIALSLWVGVAVVGFYTAYTIFDVPHMALGAEISLQTTERNKIFGVRQLCRILGTAAAGILGTYLVSKGTPTVLAMSYTVALVTIVLVFTGVSFLPPERASFKGRGGENPYKAVRDVWANPHAKLLLFVIFIDAIGVGGIGVLMPFLLEYVVKSIDMLPVFMGINMAASLLMVPGWVFLARYFEKRTLLLWSFMACGIGYGLIMFVGEHDTVIMVFSCLLAGGGTTCLNVLGYSLKSEIIDCDELLTGERKEGTYFAGWSFVNKLAHGIMIGLVGFSLQWTDFQPNVAEQTDLVKQNIVFLMGGLPLICFSIGAIAFSRFSLSPQTYAKVRQELDERASKTT